MNLIVFNLPKGPAQQWAIATVLTTGLLLVGGHFFEFIMGLAPCPLCMTQRVFFFLCGLIAYISLLHHPRVGIYPLLGILAAMGGAFFSIRQLWLQSLPEDQVPACGPDLAYMLDVFPMQDLLAAMTSGTGDCAATAWSFLGISIPGYALLGFVLIAVLNTLQLREGLR